MNYIAWPYGTRKYVTVINVDNIGAVKFLFLGERDGDQGFVLMSEQDFEQEVGEYGVITFSPGGATGGYWDYKKDLLI